MIPRSARLPGRDGECWACWAYCCWRGRGRSSVGRTYATVPGTRDYFARQSAQVQANVRTVPKRGWQTSRLGFGAYRIGDDHPGHRQALGLALSSGINLVDTSTHFGHGRSEQAIGSVLADLMREGRVTRDQVILVSKAGYLLRDAPAHPTTDSTTFPDTVPQANGNAHCIHPDFLEQQLAASLARLRTNSLDLFLLNAPDLLRATMSEARMYEAIQRAFAYLAAQVAGGRIGGYGIASPALGVGRGSRLDLATVLEQSRAAGTLEHFVCIEYPLNLHETAALPAVTSSDVSASAPAPSLVQVANEHGLFQLTQRPIHAIRAGSVRPLRSYPPVSNASDVLGTISATFEEALALEMQLSEMLTQPSERELVVPFIWASIVAENVAQLTANLVYCQHYFHAVLWPALRQDLQRLRAYAQQVESPELQDWVAQYEDVLHRVTEAVFCISRADMAAKSEELLLVLNSLMPGSMSTVSRHAVHAVASVLEELNAPACTLVGARELPYMKEALEVNALPRASSSEEDRYASVFSSPALQMLH